MKTIIQVNVPSYRRNAIVEKLRRNLLTIFLLPAALAAGLVTSEVYAAPGDLLWAQDIGITRVSAPGNTTQDPASTNTENVDVELNFRVPAPGTSTPGAHRDYYMDDSSGTQGGDMGYFQMQMNATTDNVSECISLRMTFDDENISGPDGLIGLSVPITDIDRLSTGYTDYVLVRGFLNGVQVSGTTTLENPGAGQTAIEGGQCDAMRTSLGATGGNCVRGIDDRVDNTSSDANATVTFSGAVNEIIVDYCAGDDPNGSDPGNQLIGIGDLFWSDTLPVTLDSFASKSQGSNLRFAWSTSSETFNFGFNVWGEVEGQWYRLNKAVVPSRGADSLVSQSYKKRVSVSDLPGEVTRVGLSSVELNGHEAFYGPYVVGEAVGEAAIIEPIDWDAVAAEASVHLAAQGYVQCGRNFVRERKANRLIAALSELNANQALSGNSVLAEFRTEEVGMHVVDHGDLLAVGVDLTGLRLNKLALTYDGEGVARHVRGRAGLWSDNSWIRWYAPEPAADRQLHTQESVYRIEKDSSRVNVVGIGR